MDEKKPVKKTGGRPDTGTLVGLLLAGCGIVGGLILEGGDIRDISQFTAALIVLGGTVGAVMVSTPMPVFLGALRRMVSVFFDTAHCPDALVEEIIQYATKARKNGLVSLEREAAEIKEPFLHKALNLAVDGTDLQEIRKMMELQMNIDEHRAECEAKVFEAAGGYAPTIGIIGAVLGLIQVMKNLANIDEVGRGIAVAFVATVYGVASANILFLPMAAKIKARIQDDVHTWELMLEGVSGIVEGLNPKLIRSKLEAYQNRMEPKKASKAKAEGKPVAAPVPAPES